MSDILKLISCTLFPQLVKRQKGKHSLNNEKDNDDQTAVMIPDTGLIERILPKLTQVSKK